jgi:hypothetical protein
MANYVLNLGIPQGTAGTDGKSLTIVSGSPFTNLAALQTAFPTGQAGDVAMVDTVQYYWDTTTNAWVEGSDLGINLSIGTVTTLTAGQPATATITPA